MIHSSSTRRDLSSRKFSPFDCHAVLQCGQGSGRDNDLNAEPRAIMAEPTIICVCLSCARLQLEYASQQHHRTASPACPPSCRSSTRAGRCSRHTPRTTRSPRSWPWCAWCCMPARSSTRPSTRLRSQQQAAPRTSRSPNACSGQRRYSREAEPPGRSSPTLLAPTPSRSRSRRIRMAHGLQ